MEQANTHYREAEVLSEEIRGLLTRYHSVLDYEGICGHVEALEHWLETYSQGLTAAEILAENGTQWLTELRDRLKLAAEELLRLEGEGGNPPTKEQATQTEDLLKATRRLDKVIPEVKNLFNPDCAKVAELEQA